MKTKTTGAKLILLAFLGLLLAIPQASAQTNAFTNATYFFTGANGNTNSMAYNGTAVDDLTIGNITKSAGITNSSSSGNFRATGWTTNSSIDTGDYIAFTLTADTGWTLNMTNMTFGIGRSATGTRDWVWYASTNAFSSSFALTNYTTVNAGLSLSAGVLSNPDSNSSWTGNVLNLSSLTNLTTIEFRLYSYNNEAAAGTSGLQGNLSFSGALISNAAPPVSDDLYWTANGTTLGGAGTWNTAGSTWSPTDTPVDPEVWDSTKRAIFTNDAATVTVATVTAERGILFATTGYTLEDGTITMGGANTVENNITTDAGVTATIDSQISGANGLAKSGSGTLILGGVNDYTGGTVVNGGRLVGTTDSLQGNITNNAAVTFDQDTDGTYSDNMSGIGSLLKDGSGTLTLSGSNSYSGGTEVADGRLVGNTDSLQGAITNNAAVTFDQDVDGVHSGAITGTGSLVKAGDGTVSLFGNNSYSGGTLVSGGGLSGTTSSLQGDITNNATVRFSQGTNGTYAGDMSGSGAFIKDNTGIVTLSGSNSYSGGTTVEAGGLVGTTTSLQGDVVNNAAVTFDQASNGTYSGEMSGTGSLTKSGAGTVTVTSANSYEGGTTISGGGIVAAASGALGTGAVDISEGSILASDGVTLENDITIGSSAGAVWVAGWDFQTTANGGTALNAAPGTPQVILANFGDQAGDATIYLDGSNGSSTWASPGSNPQLTAFGGTAVNATNTAVAPPNEMSTVTSGASSLALANSSANGQSVVFTFDMTGLSDLSLSYASQRSGTGFNVQQWAYSTNGTTWTDFWTNNAIASSFELEAAPSAITGLDGIATAYLRLTVDGASATSGNNRLDNILLNATGGFTGSGTLGIHEAGAATFSGNITVNNVAALTAASGGLATFSGVISGDGTDIAKTGAGTVTLSGAGANTFGGKTTVSEGVLELAKDADTTAIAGDLEVEADAVLLISASEQVADTSEITLSGGTIFRGAGVSETFGNLILNDASTLSYGSTAESSFLEFGELTLNANVLTVENFFLGNQLRYLAADYAAGFALAETFDFVNSHPELGYSFGGGTFTITAIPEPSTYAAAAGLLGMMLWPARRRILRDTKRILGLRTPMRDRLGRRDA